MQTKAVINACGVHIEDILAWTAAARGSLLAMSQGTHFVLPRSFLPGDTALMIPKTADGRVLFAIPWHGAVIVGTTDVPVESTPPSRARCLKKRNFLLDHITRYFGRAPRPQRSSASGPACGPWSAKAACKTSKLSRDHTILVSPSGLITVTGGKWTTYRRMGQDTIDRACEVASLPKQPSRTLELKLHGWTADLDHSELRMGTASTAPICPSSGALSERAIAASRCLLHPRLPFRLREVVWSARYEMARTVEDVLARRTRALFLDARAAIEAAPAVASLLARELHRSEAWKAKDLESFVETAKGYIYEE